MLTKHPMALYEAFGMLSSDVYAAYFFSVFLNIKCIMTLAAANEQATALKNSSH